MGIKYEMIFLTAITFAALYFLGCASEPAYLENLTFVKDALINYHENGEFDTDTQAAVKKAIEELDKITPGEKSVVVFDVDETALSNYPFNKEQDFGYVEKYFDMWIDSAKAQPVTEVLNLYKYLIKRNFRVIFVTGRKTYQYDATFKNLISAGFTLFDTLIVKDKKYFGKTALKYKADKRMELVSKGYKIVGTVGDQWSDLEGSYTGIKIKIPNYQYYIY
jgi:acid phosphatase